MATNLIGKIILKKKSGPGDITGLTEIDLINDGSNSPNSIFKGIQFTDPGDYVITISSTSKLIDSKDISVKVLPQDLIISQEDRKSDIKPEKNVDGTRPIISQIDKPTIKVKKIEMDQDVPGGAKSDYHISIGYTPVIWYKSYRIEDRDIISLSLYHEGIVPKIKFTFEDTKDIMKGESGPKDNTTMDFFLNSTSSNLKSIHFVFKIEEFIQGPIKPSQRYTITGTINIPDLYIVNNKSYNDTSFSAIRKMCSEMGIGFNSNISNTDDKMTWRNSNKKPHEFIDEIVSRSYISDESFMVGYIDYYYCFNYVDIEKEMKRDITNDVGIDTSVLAKHSSINDEARISRLSLSNDRSQSGTCFFIESFSARNDSTKKSIKDGSFTVTKTYDRINKMFQVFNVDSTTSDGSESIILKGGDNDSKYFKENAKHKFVGKLDTDNVHKNYNYSITQNRINLDTLNKIVLNVKIPNANYNLYKFQKVNVIITNDTETPSQTSKYNYRYSGDYIIADITFNWAKGKMNQELRLVRKELGKTPDEIKNNPPVQTKPEIKEINNNPVTGPTASIAPNSIYVINQTYIVKDSIGSLYSLRVMGLSDNGTEVLGTLTPKN